MLPLGFTVWLALAYDKTVCYTSSLENCLYIEALPLLLIVDLCCHMKTTLLAYWMM